MSSPSLVAKLRRLLKPEHSLDEVQLNKIEAYLKLLAHWNRRINLTALPMAGFPEATLIKLVIEPLAAVELVPRAEFSWFDLGSGGGSPAIPLKVAAQAGELRMVESRSRKAAFLREVVRELQLSGTRVLCQRIEDLTASQDAESVDVITARAVRLTTELVGVAVRLLRPGGSFIHFARHAGLGSIGAGALVEVSRSTDATAFRRM